MNPFADHKPGCVLDPVHWLRHATGAAIRLLNDDEQTPDDDKDHLDRESAVLLLTALEHFAELDSNWAAVTLRDLAVAASPTDDRFQGLCTCKNGTGPVTQVRL